MRFGRSLRGFGGAEWWRYLERGGSGRRRRFYRGPLGAKELREFAYGLGLAGRSLLLWRRGAEHACEFTLRWRWSSLTRFSAASTLEFMSQRLQKLQSRAEFYYKCVYLSQHIGVPLPGEICHSPAPARSVVLRLPELAVRLFVPQSCIKGLSMRQIPPYGTTMPVLASCLEMDADRALMVFQVKKAAGIMAGKQPGPTAR
ncbi:hypothetical protein FBQ85_26425 [Cytophagia bacterium CHB2]|nr:hypothetical protein [Cytophagia bacterium CHB2]